MTVLVGDKCFTCSSECMGAWVIEAVTGVDEGSIPK